MTPSSCGRETTALTNLTLQNWIGEPNPLYNDVNSVLLNPGSGNCLELHQAGLWYTAFFTALLGVAARLCHRQGRAPGLPGWLTVGRISPMSSGLAFGAVYIAMFARKIGPFLLYTGLCPAGDRLGGKHLPTHPFGGLGDDAGGA